MAVTVPDWADTLLDVIGVSWPNVDEDAYRDMADSLRDFADDLEDDGQLANGHVSRLLSSGSGEALDALNLHWGQVKDKHLKDISSAARIIAGALDTAATAVEAMKGAALVQLGYLAEEAGIALSLIPVTGGLSALLGAGAIRATQEVVRRLIKECGEEAVGYVTAALTEPAVAALEGMAADLVVQVGASALGLQDGVDLDQAKQAGKEGFKEGVQGSKEAMQLASADGAGGGAGGGTKRLHIEHSEHDHASTQLSGLSVNFHGKTAGRLSTAKSHHSRTRGRDSIAEVIDPVADKAMDALEKALKTMGNHVSSKLPKAVKQISTDHKNNDADIGAGFAKDRKKADGGDSGSSRKDGGKRGASHVKPDSLSGAKDDPRGKAIPLNKRRCATDPVDVASGEMVLGQTDLSLPGVLPITLQRTHISSYRYGHFFGRSWASTLDERIELDPLGGGAVWAREDGSLLVYPRLPRPQDTEPVMPLEGPRLPLAFGGTDNADTRYRITEPDTGLTRWFTGSPYNESVAYWLTGVEDRNDNLVTVDRRGDGTPLTVMHDGGYRVQLTVQDRRVRTLALAAADRPVTVMTYGYDEQGNLDAVTNSSGLPLRFTYDPDGRITSWTDRNNSTYRYMYDAVGRVTGTVGPDGYLSSSFTYDTEARTTRYIDSTGAVTTYQLNERLQIVAESDPLGHTVRQEWDRHDNLLTRTDEHGRTAAWTWDDSGNLRAVRMPDGTEVSAQYNELHLPVEVTDADGAAWRYEYDDRGNHVALVGPDGATTRFEHDAHGAIRAIVDAAGGRETFVTNEAGIPVSLSDALGNTTTLTRDSFGRPVAVTDPLGGVTLLEWTLEGLLQRRVEPDGSERSWTYDAEGNCLTETDPNGGVTRYAYTHFDQPVARTTPDGARHEFVYDTELRLLRVLNGRGLSWEYEYDAAGRVVAEKDFDGRVLRYTYDIAGRSLTRTNPLGQAITHHLDDAGQLVAKDADGVLTEYTYDRAGRLLGAVSPDSAVVFERDSRGRIVSETVDGHITRYSHDVLGRRIGRVTPSGVATNARYDQVGNRVGLDIAGHVLDFTHDPMGRELTRSFGPENGPVTLTTVWGRAGINEQSLATPTRTVRSRAYSYRADGLLSDIIDRLTGGTRTFQLDPMGRPLRVDARNWSETYAYDLDGNQTSADWPDRARHPEARGERTYSGMRIQSAGGLRYRHDAAGRIVERRKTRLSRKPDVWRYTWDAEDRLTSCTTPDGTLWTYAYDALGRRIAKRRHDAEGAVVQEVCFTWDGSHLAEQTDAATATTITWEYEGHRPLGQLERKPAAPQGEGSDQDSVDSRFFAIVTDLIGAPTELVDERGEIAWYARSTLWGTTMWNKGSSAYTPLRFPGQYADPETGLHYNHFRHYDPETGRYATPDPLGLDPAPNPVAYVNNPAAESDPLGLAPCLQSLEDAATKIAQLLPKASQRYQTVAAIHVNTPNGPAVFVSGTSRSKLTPAQVKLAKEMGFIPLPNDQYIPKPAKGERGGHAEQNIINFLGRMNEKGGGGWMPTHGAATRSVCADICAPVIRAGGGLMTGEVYQKEQPTRQHQFFWPGQYVPD
ncbi:RHS repeat-associated core domain-containing protein [Streptomyces botrytidirepellens]|uniref:RHS repeat protein n=1 Tax=Streptomyces botrytidirepellens TaxID=2486417 RepID=A0A3M8STN7_9ACTN|nr:RHS repeat-associated core domain-containing protein [Streptomyces botrytidirepellens]RNF84678.1 RHS repeat protein [Streptomyces botrytidirepellens]